MSSVLEQPDSDSTRQQILDAAERLFLSQGLEGVSLRAIGREAGQRNQSALQYHFGNREGLIRAIIERRMNQLEARRSALLETEFDLNADPSVRDCCALLVRAPFLLCREQRNFRQLLGMMGSFLMSPQRQPVLQEAGDNSSSLHRVGQVIFRQLGHVSPELLSLRIEYAQGATLLAIARRALHGGSFRGPRAELFYNNLVDQLAAMLEAPVSEETAAALDLLGSAKS